MRHCTRCGNDYEEYPAISRADNKTEICSSCGTDEAMICFVMHQKGNTLEEITQTLMFGLNP